VLQVLANAVVYTSEIALIAIGISLSYAILRFANFAHIQYAVVGGYLTYVAHLWLDLLSATAVSAVLTGLLAVAIDRLVFAHLRHATAESRMIISWGVALFLRSVLAAVFGGSARTLPVEAGPVEIGGALVTTLDLAVVATAALSVVALHLLLFRTRIGTALRALASNPELAETRGIPSERMIALMWFLAGAYAGIGGTLFALETRLQPNMDLLILLPVFAAVTIGGLGNVFGAVAGALALSLAQNWLIAIDFGALLGAASSWYVPTQFRDAIAVAALVLVLLIRPPWATAPRPG
jgi:branched-subunit amino acid ABC-type transport system permease component